MFRNKYFKRSWRNTEPLSCHGTVGRRGGGKRYWEKSGQEGTPACNLAVNSNLAIWSWLALGPCIIFQITSNIIPQSCQLVSPVRAFCRHLMTGQWIMERTTSIKGMWSITLQSSYLWNQVDPHGHELADNTGSEGLGLWSTDSYYAIPGMAWLGFWVGSYEDHVKDLIDSTYSSSAILFPDPSKTPFPNSFWFKWMLSLHGSQSIAWSWTNIISKDMHQFIQCPLLFFSVVVSSSL